MTILVNKCGCNSLVHTYSYVHGDLSHRQMQRHMNQYNTVPHFCPRLSSCIASHQGLKAIEMNMNDYFANDKFLTFLPMEKCTVSLLIGGVNIDEMLGLDEDQYPHQVTGVCRHCNDATFADYADALRIQDGLDSSKFHLAKEAEMLCIGFNHPSFTSLIPVAISPTCKKDGVKNESTNTVKVILMTSKDVWHKYEISERFIMTTYNSDGAGQFRKAVGQVLNGDLPVKVRNVYVAPDGASTKRCPLLNLVGGAFGTTAACDNDHLGKRFRARLKTPTGIHFHKGGLDSNPSNGYDYQFSRRSPSSFPSR
jgi:hypothetical protein